MHCCSRWDEMGYKFRGTSETKCSTRRPSLCSTTTERNHRPCFPVDRACQSRDTKDRTTTDSISLLHLQLERLRVADDPAHQDPLAGSTRGMELDNPCLHDSASWGTHHRRVRSVTDDNFDLLSRLNNNPPRQSWSNPEMELTWVRSVDFTRFVCILCNLEV